MQWVRRLSPLGHKIRQAIIQRSKERLKQQMDLKKWLSIVQAVTPLVVSAINPALGAVSGLIVHAVGEAETIPGATGQQKKDAAMQIVTDGINVTNNIAQKTVVDPAVVPTVSDIVDDVVEAANTLHDKPVATTTMPPQVSQPISQK